MTNPTIENFLNSVAAKQPMPGGGAVAAMCGALAAAIGEMAINYSIGRKATPQFDEELKRVLGGLTRARAMMLELGIEDQEAFAALSAAKKLEKSDPTRPDRIAAGVEACIAVPRAIGATALTLLRLIEPIVEKSNKWLLSDLAVCVELAMATIRTAQYNVKANLGDVSSDRGAALRSECDEGVRIGVARLNRCLAKISGGSVA